MANQELIKFIAEKSIGGHTEKDIRAALKGKGWADSDIDMAYDAWKSNPTLPDRKEVGRFIGESWNLYRELFRRFLALYGRFALWGLAAAIPGVAIFAALRVTQNNGSLSEDAAGVAYLVLGAIYIIIFVYLAVWAQVSTILVVRQRATVVPAKDIMNQAKPFLGAYFLTSVLVGLLTFLWTLLLIIPGIIFGIYYMMAEYIVVDRNIRGMAAVRLSKRLIDGLWWQVFTSVLALAGVSILFFLAISALGAVLGKEGSDLLTTLAQVAYGPYAVIYMVLLYERLKALKPDVQ